MSGKIYVRMSDRFMSGWGACVGKRNVLVIVCDDWRQAEAIRRAAVDRPDMQRVAIVGGMPRARRGVLYSVKPFADMLGPWREYYAPEPVEVPR
jgi:hypothetical protein